MSVLERVRSDESPPAMSAPADLSGAAGFRQAMREFATGVSIIACGEGDQRAGCTATALSSLSLAPPTLVVCLDRNNSTFGRLREVGAFSVNLLGDTHESLAGRFAGRGGLKGAERFAVGDWISLVTGAPILADALAAIDCRVEEIIERHTHAIVIGAVQAVRVSGDQPALLHWRSRFEQLG